MMSGGTREVILGGAKPYDTVCGGQDFCRKGYLALALKADMYY